VGKLLFLTAMMIKTNDLLSSCAFFPDRQLILKYHPDKQASGGDSTNMENAFACIKIGK
jgi:hypothetical protein